VRFRDSDAPEVFQYVPGYYALTPAKDIRDSGFLVIIGQDASRVAGELRRNLGM
jgi:hypothetical protein